MLSICIPSTSKKRLILNLSNLSYNLEKLNLRKKIELCLHINGEEIKNSEIFLLAKLNIQHKISFSLRKQTYQESYKSVVSLATQKYILVIEDTDKINLKNLENFLKDLKNEKYKYMSFLFDNNKSIHNKKFDKCENKFLKLNSDNYSKLFNPKISFLIGNTIYNSQYLKYCLKKSYKLLTEYPQLYPYFISLINSLSAFYSKPIVAFDNNKKFFNSRNGIYNNFDLIRVFSYTINESSKINISFKFLKLIFISIKSLPKDLFYIFYNNLTKRKYTYPITNQSIFETLKSFIDCVFLPFFILLNKLLFLIQKSNLKRNMIAIIGARRYYSVYNSCKNKISNLIFASDIIFNEYESNFLIKIFRKKEIKAKIKRRSLEKSGGEEIIRFNWQFIINSLKYNIYKKRNHKSRIYSYVEDSIRFSKLINNKTSIYTDFYNFTYSCNSSAAPLFINQRNKSKYLILEQTIAPFFYQQEVIIDELNKHPQIYDYDSYFDKNNNLGKLGKIEEFYSQMEILEWELSDYILCPSDFVKEILNKKGISNKKLIKLNYGINPDLFADIRKIKLERIDEIINKEKLNVLFIGEFGLRKGAAYIMEAFNKLSHNHFSLKVAGNVDIKRKLLETSFINFEGHCSFEMIKGLLLWADIFIMPSLAEGSAIAGTEAICSGVPVIATKESGINFKENFNGKLIKSRDSNSLYIALHELYKDRFLLKELIKNCCKISYKDFSDKIYSKNLLNFLINLN